MLAALIAAGAGELGAAAAAATATAATAAPVVAPTVAAPLLMAAPAAEAVAAPLVAETLAVPAAEGIASSAAPAAEAMANGAAQGITATAPEAASTVGQEVANTSVQQAIQNGQGGLDAYGQFTQAPGPIDPTAANPGITQPYVNAPPTPGTPGNPIDINAGLERGIDYEAIPGFDIPHAGAETAKTGLQKGFESALKFTKDHPLATSLGIQAVGKLMDSGGGGGGPQKKTATRKDMSGFNASNPSTVAYNPIYQPTPYAEGGIAYAMGGPVEQMSAQNAIGANTGYPMANLQTPMYTNPQISRPTAANVIAPSVDTGVDSYTGDIRFAEGGATGSGSLDLHVPIDLGASGIAQGGAGGYSAGAGGQSSTLSTATGAPSQTAQQPPAAMAPAATAEPLNIQPRGNSYIPSVQWKQTVGGMGSMSRYDYTVNDSAADAYVKANAGTNLNLNQGQADRAKIEELYKKYYQGYAKGGTTKSGPNYSEMMGIRSAEQQKADEEYLQAFNKREMAGSIHTDSDIETAKQDPMHASMTRLKKIGKRVGIKPVELPKSAVTDANVFHAANGGIMHNLGGYSDGGRLLKGPGDGVSDSIPATIGNKQPARLADGEFVVPARIVSELGNGSTEAGARKLYEMMERVQADRKKSIGKGKVAVNSKAAKHLPK